jgi:uncharacterized protein (TIGR03086 family)
VRGFGIVAEEVELLGRALAQTGEVIRAVGQDQADRPTPCTDWDVRALVRHVVCQDLRNFLIAARGETADWRAPAGELEADWAAQFDRGARTLLDAWNAADLDRLVTVPGGGEAPLRSRASHQIAELAMHSWDLARATGAPVTLDPDLAEHGWAWSRTQLQPQFRGPGKAFGVEVSVPDGARAYDRLAGWFGRDPGWTPAQR